MSYSPKMLRKKIKHWLYGSCPGVAGAFPYFGTKVYFPKGSPSFLAACQQGVFEAENVNLLRSLASPDTWVFDIGANIGLMSVPILWHEPTVRIAAFEPSPNAFPWLTRTIEESPYKDRWTLYPSAVGASDGVATFFLASKENSWFEGTRATGRAPSTGTTEVRQTTVDSAWRELGMPRVSVIKSDVEGGEWEVLEGATGCLKECRPYVLLEWNRTNLSAHGRDPKTLLEFAETARYRVLAVPRLVGVTDACELELHMALTETFLLVPRADVPRPTERA
jgi:FkbM family methyltransferase